MSTSYDPIHRTGVTLPSRSQRQGIGESLPAPFVSAT